MATKVLWGNTQPGNAFLPDGRDAWGKIVPFGGGIFLLYDNYLIGATGVSVIAQNMIMKLPRRQVMCS